jgi:hypothetical protein
MSESDADTPKYNLLIKQGTTKDFSLQITDDNGVPKSLAGYDAYMQIRSRPGGELYADLTSDPAAGMTITEATGTVDVRLTAAQTKIMGFQTAVFDIMLKSSTGYVLCAFEGEVRLNPMVTVIP